MLQITDNAVEQRLWPLLRQAFRPFFLLGALFALVSVGLWLAALSGWLALPVAGDLLFWHRHEMLFGFVAAIVVGFLLTAVQNWTGLRAIHGTTLGILVVLWLVARLLYLLGGGLPLVWVMLIDLAFLPTAAVLLALPLIRIQQRRNLIFVPILLLLTLCNALLCWGYLEQRSDIMQSASHSTILLITLLMALMGGRVIPMFTANGLGLPRVASRPWLDRTALASIWVLLFVELLQLRPQFSLDQLSALYLGSALLVGCRAARWQSWKTLSVPLLWSLHFAYWMIPLGLLLYALHLQTYWLSASTAIHTLTVGAMGSMILAMIARVSLGHSGRPLTPHKWMSIGFAALIVATIARVGLIALWPQYSIVWLWLAGSAWLIGFGLYLVLYRHILMRPRADGRPG